MRTVTDPPAAWRSPTASSPQICSPAGRSLVPTSVWGSNEPGARRTRMHPSHALIPMGGWCASAAALRNRATTVRTRRRLRRFLFAMPPRIEEIPLLLDRRLANGRHRWLRCYLLTGGWLMGGTVGYLAVGYLPRRSPGGRRDHARPVLPEGPCAADPA
jgi:hypothetical protein